jgi:hypothetical protein
MLLFRHPFTKEFLYAPAFDGAVCEAQKIHMSRRTTAEFYVIKIHTNSRDRVALCCSAAAMRRFALLLVVSIVYCRVDCLNSQHEMLVEVSRRALSRALPSNNSTAAPKQTVQ